MRGNSAQDCDRLQGKRLMQRRERNVALEVGQHCGVHAHRCRILRCAMHHAVHDRRRRQSAGLPYDARADFLQRGVIRLVLANPLDAAGPHRLARQRLDACIEQGELDA